MTVWAYLLEIHRLSRPTQTYAVPVIMANRIYFGWLVDSDEASNKREDIVNGSNTNMRPRSAVASPLPPRHASVAEDDDGCDDNDAEVVRLRGSTIKFIVINILFYRYLLPTHGTSFPRCHDTWPVQ